MGAISHPYSQRRNQFGMNPYLGMNQINNPFMNFPGINPLIPMQMMPQFNNPNILPYVNQPQFGNFPNSYGFPSNQFHQGFNPNFPFNLQSTPPPFNLYN